MLSAIYRRLTIIMSNLLITDNMEAKLLEPGKTIKPDVTIDQARLLVESNYNLKVDKITEIIAYDDRNYLIKSEKTVDDYGDKFIFKITNSLDSAYSGLIEAINDVSIYIDRFNQIKVPIPLTNKNGSFVSRIELKSGETNAIRLMKYIPGTVLNQIDYSEDAMIQIGKKLGQLTKILKNYSNPVLETRQTIWSLSCVPKLDKFLFAVDDSYRRSLVQEIINEFGLIVGNVVTSFRAQIIHGDMNEQNILFDRNEGDDKWKFAGLIDFGDVHKAPIVFDLALLCCYVTLDCQQIDPIKAPCYVIKGFLSEMQLTEQEWNILPICVMARLAQSLTLGAYSYLNDPGNEYLLTTSKKGWSILEKLRKIGPKELLNIWSCKTNSDD